jgi:hypothetical protein
MSRKASSTLPLAFLEIECFQGLVVEAVRITLALRGGFENPRRDDFSNRRGDAASLK